MRPLYWLKTKRIKKIIINLLGIAYTLTHDCEKQLKFIKMLPLKKKIEFCLKNEMIFGSAKITFFIQSKNWKVIVQRNIIGTM